MKASTLIENLQKLIDIHGDLDLIYAKDDEGNGYERIHYDPSLYIFEDRDDVRSIEDCLENGDEFTPNAICVN